MSEELGRLEVTATRIVYENRWLRLREDETLLPDGQRGLYAYVQRAPAALIVPLDDDDRLWLVEQWRHTLGGRFIEFPQGTIEGRADLEPEAVARAELVEETGLRAGALEHLGRLRYAPGALDQAFDVWLARELEPGPAQPEPTEQGLDVVVLAREEVLARVRDGSLVDSPSVAALWLLEDHLRHR